MTSLSAVAALILASSAAVASHDATVPLQTIAKDASPAIRPTMQFVDARTPAQWSAAWQLLATDANGEVRISNWQARLPAVDFDRSMVIGVILATHPSSCTGVTITNASMIADRLVVHYRVRQPIRNEGCASSFFMAYHFASVPTTTGPVVFVAESAEQPAQR